MYDISANKFVKFQIKISSGCWENGKKTLGGYYIFAAPCTQLQQVRCNISDFENLITKAEIKTSEKQENNRLMGLTWAERRAQQITFWLPV